MSAQPTNILLDNLGTVKLYHMGSAREYELGADSLESPEWASAESLENTYDPKFDQYHSPRPVDDLFTFGLVMLYIGFETSCKEMMSYYATRQTAVCTPDSYIVLRICRSLFAALMRHYYMSKDFSIFVSACTIAGTSKC